MSLAQGVGAAACRGGLSRPRCYIFCQTTWPTKPDTVPSFLLPQPPGVKLKRRWVLLPLPRVPVPLPRPARPIYHSENLKSSQCCLTRQLSSPTVPGRVAWLTLHCLGVIGELLPDPLSICCQGARHTASAFCQDVRGMAETSSLTGLRDAKRQKSAPDKGGVSHLGYHGPLTDSSHNAADSADRVNRQG
ncbi:hypothetical protein ACOMHN_008087 [Nucella lapillus]